MIRKRKIAIVIAGALLLAGVAFGVSANNRDTLKSDVFGAGFGRGNFVCTPQAVAPGSRETKQYIANLAELKRLQAQRAKLQSDTNVLNNTCKSLKNKAKSKCQQDVAELRKVNGNLAKINVKIEAYESCKEKFTTSKCGSAVNTIFDTKPVNNLCASGKVMSSPVMFDPTIRGSNGNGTWEWACGDGTVAWPDGTSTNSVRCNADSSVANPVPTCGPATTQTYSNAPTDYLCVSGVLSDPVGFDPTIRGTNGNGTWEWSCGDGSVGWPSGTSVNRVRCNADSSVAKPEVKCGPAIRQTYSNAPTDYLCESGVLSNPVMFDPTIRGSNGNGTWEWGCGDGSVGFPINNSTNTIRCNADSSIAKPAPQCGEATRVTYDTPPTAYLCTSGVATPVMFDPTIIGKTNTNGTWEWACTDGTVAGVKNDGKNIVRCNADSSVAKPDPICGAATGATYDAPPTAYLCTSGIVTTPVMFDPTIRGSNGNGTWEWGCGDGVLASSNIRCNANSSVDNPTL